MARPARRSPRGRGPGRRQPTGQVADGGAACLVALMAGRVNIILSPHFHDAVFSLGGLIATAPERSVFVTVFAGMPAAGIAGRWDRRSGFKSGAEAMRARALENEAGVAALQVPPSAIVNLDFLDRQYRPKASIAGLRSAIAETVRQIAGR